MELTVLGTDLIALDPIDRFESLIWRDRYCGFGDFEILSPVNNDILLYVAQDRYLTMAGTEHAMIIETLGIKSDAELGNKILVIGRSLESILKRRIVWKQTILTGNFQNGVLQLLNENAIIPENPDRQISRLVFEASTDLAVTSLTVDAQFVPETDKTLYDAIVGLCQAAGVGFKITITDSGQFLFKLYAGKDRSYDQIENPYVIFSPEFDNVLKGEYSESKMPLKTLALVGGQIVEGVERLMIPVTIPGGAGTDLDRREMFVDASSISTSYDGGELTPEQYLAELIQVGQQELSKKTAIQSFEGEADTTGIYKYGEDFDMGDILEVANEYGHSAKSRVSEVIHSQDSSGIKVYPAFTAV